MSGNGNLKTLYWILGAVFTLLISLMGYILHNIDSRLTTMESLYSSQVSETRAVIERRLAQAETKLDQGARFTREDWYREYNRLDARIRRLERRSGLDVEGP